MGGPYAVPFYTQYPTRAVPPRNTNQPERLQSEDPVPEGHGVPSLPQETKAGMIPPTLSQVHLNVN